MRLTKEGMNDILALSGNIPLLKLIVIAMAKVLIRLLEMVESYLEQWNLTINIS